MKKSHDNLGKNVWFNVLRIVTLTFIKVEINFFYTQKIIALIA